MKLVQFILVAFCMQTPTFSQWVQTSGPEGGGVWSIAEGGGTMFAAVNSSIYKSSNLGATWSFCFSNGDRNIDQIAFSSTNIFAVSFTGVWLSQDNGSSWHHVGGGLPSFIPTCIASVGADVYVGTISDGVLLSGDTGQSWTPVDSGLTSQHIYCLISTGNELFAGTDSGIFQAPISNVIWTPSGNGYPAHRITAMAYSGSVLFAGYFNGSGSYISIDNGVTWSYVLGYGQINSFATEGANVYAGTFDGLYKYDYPGNSWIRIDTNWVCTYVSSLWTSGGTILAGTNAGGIYRSLNGGFSWNRSNGGLVSSYILSMKVRNNELLAGTYGHGVVSTPVNGLFWQYITNEFMGPVNDIEFFDSTIIAGCPFYTFTGGGDGTYISSDHGINWEMTNDLYTNCVLNDSGIIYVGTISGLYVSPDTFVTWIPNNPLGNKDVRSVYRFGQKLFAGTCQGIFVSTDNGSSWDSTGISGTCVNRFLADGQILYVATYNGVYCSTDSGNTWIQKSVFWANDLVLYNSLLVSCTSGGGVFFSTDSGTTWISYNAGLTNTYVTCLAVLNNYLFSGTSGSGVFRTAYIPTEISDADSSFTLNIFPNPAINGFTVLLDKIIDGDIRIYNVSGEMVFRELIERSNQIEINPSLSSGVYTVSINYKDGVMAKKIVIK